MTLHDEPATSVRPEVTACADWLTLRRDADTRARDEGAGGLLRRLVDHLGGAGDASGERSGQGSGGEVRVVDLGAGTGANHRYLAPRLPFAQRWTAVDHDATLLAAPGHDGADRVVADVADLRAVLTGLPGDGPVLVTCSALLDVLTAHQLAALADAILSHDCPALLALSVTGAVTWSPAHPDDGLVGAAFNAHQGREGRPGPQAVHALADRLRNGGAAVTEAPTPWRLDASDPGLLGRWLDERVDAALESLEGQGPEGDAAAAAVRSWRDLRAAQLASGSLAVVVDHVDLLVLPPGSSPSGLHAP